MTRKKTPQQQQLSIGNKSEPGDNRMALLSDIKKWEIYDYIKFTQT